jgi:hypothetical protein
MQHIISSQSNGQWQELAGMLKTEWQGHGIDRQRALELARALMPTHPELRHTLSHLQNRLSA